MGLDWDWTGIGPGLGDSEIDIPHIRHKDAVLFLTDFPGPSGQTSLSCHPERSEGPMYLAAAD